MKELLAFIVMHMDFLWSGARFRISDSIVSTVNGESAVLIVESNVLRLRFTRDRGQIILEFQSALNTPADDWASLDIIKRMLTGSRENSGILDESYANFVKTNLAQIEQLFDSDNIESTSKTVKALKRVRAKELFG